jgi:hypothetical protein
MEEDTEGFIEDDAIVLEDSEDSTVDDAQTANIIPFIMEKYNRAEDYRQQDEDRWLRAYRNYRGIYGPDVQFTEAEKSRVFIKITKTKTLAAYGQIVDVLFAGQKFPLTVDPTELPDGVVEDVSFDPAEPDNIREDGKDKIISPYGFKGDGMMKQVNTLLCLKQSRRYLMYLYGTFIQIQMQTIWMKRSM